MYKFIATPARRPANECLLNLSSLSRHTLTIARKVRELEMLCPQHQGPSRAPQDRKSTAGCGTGYVAPSELASSSWDFKCKHTVSTKLATWTKQAVECKAYGHHNTARSGAKSQNEDSLQKYGWPWNTHQSRIQVTPCPAIAPARSQISFCTRIAILDSAYQGPQPNFGRLSLCSTCTPSLFRQTP